MGGRQPDEREEVLARRRSSGTGRRLLSVVFLLFLAAFELSHPTADLLHLEAHRLGFDHNTPVHGSHTGEDPARDAHGPFMVAPAPLPAPPQMCCGPSRSADRVPDSPSISIPSPVPIAG